MPIWGLLEALSKAWLILPGNRGIRKIRLYREAVRKLGLEGKPALAAQRRPHPF